MTGKKGFTIIELTVVVGIFFLMISVLMPFAQMAKARYHKITCANNLMRISLALHSYAREHGGKFPEDIGALYPDYVQDPELFNCPATKKRGAQAEPEYLYAKGLKAGSREVIVEDIDGNHGKAGKNVLRVDGTVEWVRSRQ